MRPENRPPTDHTGKLEQALRFGRVVEVDLENGKVRLALGDPDGDDVETDWLPMRGVRAGATRTWSPLSEGEQVLLACPHGDIAQGVILPGEYSDQFAAPGNSKRELVTFEDGTVLAYDPEANHLDMLIKGSATMRVEAMGGVTIVGDTVIQGDVRIEGETTMQARVQMDEGVLVKGNLVSEQIIAAINDVVGGSVSLAQHRHPGVVKGTEESERPLPGAAVPAV